MRRAATALLIPCLLCSACHRLLPFGARNDTSRSERDLSPADSPLMPRPERPPGEGASTADLPAVAPDAPFTAVRPVAELNTLVEEDDPTLTGDMLVIFFERFGELYTASRASTAAPFGAPTPIAELNDNSAWEATPEVSTDGLTLYFSSDRVSGGAAQSSDIYRARRASRNEPWTLEGRVAELSDATGNDYSATPSESGLVLYLDSDRAAQFNRDLYVATRSKAADPWGTPVPLVQLNSGEQEISPWIDATGLVLFYASDYGAGAHDLRVSVRAGVTAELPKGTRLDPSVNTGFDEEDPWLSADLRTLYFTRSSPADYGPVNTDIYVATR